MIKSVPPLNELFGMAGMELPKYLGKIKSETTDTVAENPEE
jgi:hypothetical protein